MKRRVQSLEVFEAHVCQTCDQLNVHVALDLHHLEVGVVLDIGQLKLVLFGVGDDVLDRLQLGHVVACLVGHIQLGIAGAQALALVALDGAHHIAFAPVVGSKCQLPVTKHAVELFQIVQGSARRSQHVAAVIAEGILREVEVRTCRGHELPDACSLGAGDSLRVEGTFDIGQQCQLHGHVALLQLFNNMEQVLARAGGHALDVLGP